MFRNENSKHVEAFLALYNYVFPIIITGKERRREEKSGKEKIRIRVETGGGSGYTLMELNRW